MKKVLIVVGVLLVVAVVAILVLSSNLGRLVKKAVETVGPRITQTTVKLGSVSLSPSSGSGSIKDFTIGNPAGYQSPFAIRLGEARLEVDPASVLTEKVHIKSVVVTDPHIVIEGGLTDNNLKKIQANVESFANSEKTAPAGDDSSPKKKLQVDEFLLSGATVEVKIAMLGDSVPPLKLPDIRLTNLGSGPEGITHGELAQRVLSEVLASVTTQVAAQAGNLGAGALDAAKGLGDGAKGTLEKVGGGVGDLFKKKK